jgi:hypothetical protein
VSGAGSGEGGPRAKATLSRELSDFLVELSIAMQKHAIYPAGHPLLNEAVDGVMRKLAFLLNERSHLSIGIARRQLIIEGVGTDPSHPLLKELAARLHKHNLGAIKVSRGVQREELGDALATVAVDPGRTTEPLGDNAEELSSKWNNVRIFPLNYERLQLVYEGKDEEGEDRVQKGGSTKAAQLWVGMARAAMMLDEDAELDHDAMSPLVVAEAIDNRQHEEAYDQVIVGYLLQIADELKKAGGTPEAIELQNRISELVKQLSPESLQKLMQMGGDMAQRKQFLLNASQGMTVEAVLDLVRAATTEGQQSISHSMMRLFSKLSRFAEAQADPARRAEVESSVRDQMASLIRDWSLEDPNPTAYGKALQRMALSESRAPETNEFIDTEPERMVQMALELGTSGPRLEAALDAMLNSANLDPLLRLLDGAPDRDFADHVWQYLDSRDILWAALSEARIDISVVERLVKRKRLSAIDPVLDVVERTGDAKQRERLLDVLLMLGDPVGPYVARRLDGTRIELQRELFLLLGRLQNLPVGFDASRYLLHSEPAVRREAIRLLLKFVETREQAIVAGVSDTDERAAFYALTAALESGCPPRALTIIRERINQSDLDSSLMTLAIRILASVDSGTSHPQIPAARGRTSQMLRAMQTDASPAATAAANKKTLDWLLTRVAQKNFFGRWKLRDKSPEMLAALAALSAYWTQVPAVQEIVALATKQNDPELRKAMGAQRVTQRMKAITD